MKPVKFKSIRRKDYELMRCEEAVCFARKFIARDLRSWRVSSPTGMLEKSHSFRKPDPCFVFIKSVFVLRW